MTLSMLIDRQSVLVAQMIVLPEWEYWIGTMHDTYKSSFSKGVQIE